MMVSWWNGTISSRMCHFLKVLVFLLAGKTLIDETVQLLASDSEKR